MTVQLIAGRSGSGKTHYCLNQIRAELAAAPLGAPLIMLVPEQATFQMEQALSDREAGIEGFHRVEICSFQRLARQMIETMLAVDLKPLTDLGRQMILRRVIWQQGEQMKVFGRAVKQSGFIMELSRTIRELRQYRKSPEMLREYAASIRDNGSGSGLGDKLEDLALVLEGYQAYIRGRYIDPDDYLDWLCSRCNLGESLAGARVWIDGFAGFTPQQYEVIGALMIHSEQVSVSLCLDPKDSQFAAAQNPRGQLDPLGVFYPVLDTCQRLTAKALECACPQLEPICFPAGGGAMPRFVKAKGIGQIEARFLSGRAGVSEVEAPADLKIVEAASRRDEVNAAAFEILRLSKEKGVRLGEMAVIVRSLEGYQELIETIFAEHGIACFSDVRRGIGYHPLIKLVRAMLGILLNDYRLDMVLEYLKSDLAPVTRDEVDRLENFCLARDIKGGMWRRDELWESDAEIDSIRRAALAPLRRLGQQLAGVQTVEHMSRGLVDSLRELRVGQQLGQWAETQLERGEIEMSQVHRQIYSDFMGVLDELVEALGDQPMELAEYAEILQAGLKQTTLPLVPPALDQVLVGTIERSRQPYIRAAFVLGMNEGVFPLSVQGKGLFSDWQRNRFMLDRFEMAPPDSERLLRERYLGYIALTRASEFLWVSYPLADAKGTLLTPSSFVGDIVRCVDGARVERLKDSRSDYDMGRIATVSQLAVQLAGMLSSGYDPVGAEVEREAAQWSELYRQAVGRERLAEEVRAGLGGVVWMNRAQLAGVEVRGPMSVSRLESFAACPFLYYCRYHLGLKAREQLKLEPIDLGRLYHRLLEGVYNAMRRDERQWRECEGDYVLGLLRQEAETIKQEERQIKVLLEQSARNRFWFGQAVEQVGRLCLSLIDMAQGGQMVQTHAELVFGANGTLPALPLTKEIELVGKIDRVDCWYEAERVKAFAVYDFKSSETKWEAAKFYYGLDLQLLSYMLVLAKSGWIEGDVEAAGAMYLPIHRVGKSHDKAPSEAVLKGEDWSGPICHKASGVINRDYLTVLDKDCEGSSRCYDFRINKNGEPGQSGSLVEGEAMADLTWYCGEILAKLARELAGGSIAIRPYRYRDKETPCQYCDYGGVCRFDPSIDTYHHLEAMRKEMVLERIANREVYDG